MSLPVEAGSGSDPSATSIDLSLVSLALDQCQGLLPGPTALQLSPVLLAYVGDAVYELYMRLHFLLPPQRIQAYHRQVVQQVRAEQQSSHLETLREHLTETELAIVRRGRNAASSPPKRVSFQVYQQATALETLVGYLYLTDPDRLQALWQHLRLDASSK
ncbi:MAG: ribonuclease III domain-containing protein [Prochlorothrix sp.]|nr:ribonuclease III domain-containing protein [Prochlorothrix sp.]